MDKPVMLCTDRKYDQNSFHVHYIQMQRDSMESVCSLYSLSSGSLPSHFRSVSPKAEVNFTIGPDDHKPPSRCSTRTVYIILAAIFIISSSIAVAVAVHEIHVIQEESAELPNYMFLNSTDTETATVADVDTTEKVAGTVSPSPQIQTDVDPRTRCYKQCTVYGKPKFGASCVDGFCTCRGEDFQEDTCLPSVDGCVVTKELHSQSAFIWDASTTAFRCNRHFTAIPANTTNDVYVIGILGNHFSESTVVNVISEDDVTKPVTLVLASHYPIRWKVEYKDLPVSEIVLASDRKLSASQVEISQENVSSSELLPIIKKEYIPVGYGDDRYHSNTAEMLKNINKLVGPVKSFLGASYADEIILKIAS